MNDPNNDSASKNKRDVLFQSEYGGIPKFVLYGFIPFLILVAGTLLVRAIWFDAGISIKGFNLSPKIVTIVVGPGILLLCSVVMAHGIYRRTHSQCVVITKDGVLLPKARFTSDVIHIRWKNLKATMWSGQISFMDVYEVTCLDSAHGTKVAIASNMFRDFDDFATFAFLIGEHMGEDWSIKGFLPGKIRGKRKKHV